MEGLHVNIESVAPKKHRDEMAGLAELAEGMGIPTDQIPENLALFMPPNTIGRVIALDYLFRKILDVPGDVVEFGVRWGRNMAVWAALLRIYDTWSPRRVIGIDTFEGLVGVSEVDGENSRIAEGNYAVPEGYPQKLATLLNYFNYSFTLGKGDAGPTFDALKAADPALTVALAFFDMDIFKPTAEALEAVKSRLVEGSIIAFDEYAMRQFPGETEAARRVLGRRRMRTVPTAPGMVWCRWDEREA